jgi:hypothetical protein
MTSRQAGPEERLAKQPITLEREELTMLTKTTLTLAAALIAVASTATLAAPVRHHSGGAAIEQGYQGSSSQQDLNEIDQSDRASSPYAGGVG